MLPFTKYVIHIPSIKFSDGCANISEHEFGEGIIVDGGKRASHLKWKFHCNIAGIYCFASQYASLDRRPCAVLIDGKIIKEQGMSEITGGWSYLYLKKFVECEIFLERGNHILEIHTNSFIPHIRGFWIYLKNNKFALLNDFINEKILKKIIINPYIHTNPGIVRKFIHNLVSFGVGNTLNKTFKYFKPASYFKRELADLIGIYTKKFAFKGPHMVQIDITNSCNNDCIGCWCNSPLLENQKMTPELKSKFIPYDKCCELLEELYTIGCREIYFSGGGEPFAHPDILRILEKSKELDFITYVNTNFTLITKEIIDEIVKMKVDHLTISVWAGDSDTYLATHPNKSQTDFKKLRENITYLNSSKKIHPYTKIYNVISSVNYTNLSSMLDFAIETCSDSIEFTMLDPIPGKTDKLLLSSIELEKLYNDALTLKDRVNSLSIKNQIVLFGYDTFLKRISGKTDAQAGVYDKERIKDIPCTIGWTFSRINADGTVNGCLKSHKLPLGNIFDQKFSEIWMGEKQIDFRLNTIDMNSSNKIFKLMGNDPDCFMGCMKTCDDIGRNFAMNKKIKESSIFKKALSKTIAIPYKAGLLKPKIITKHYNYTKDRHLLGYIKGDRALSGPLLIVMDIINACNLSCMHCFTYSPFLKEEKPEQQWNKHKLEFSAIKKVVSDLKELGTMQIRFSGGGEPLLHPDIFEIIPYCKNNGIQVALTTNLYRVTKDKLEKLILNPPDELSISIMSGNKETYITMHPGAAENDFNELISNIAEIRNRTRCKIILCNVLSNLNYKDFNEMISLALKLKVNGVNFNIIDCSNTELKGLELSENNVNELIEIISESEFISTDNNQILCHNIPGLLENLNKKIGSTAGKKSNERDIPCSVGWHFSRILASGDVVPCCKASFIKIGNIRDSAFMDIWNNSKYNDFRRKSRNMSDNSEYFKKLNCFTACDNFEHNRAFYIDKIALI